MRTDLWSARADAWDEGYRARDNWERGDGLPMNPYKEPELKPCPFGCSPNGGEAPVVHQAKPHGWWVVKCGNGCRSAGMCGRREAINWWNTRS